MPRLRRGPGLRQALRARFRGAVGNAVDPLLERHVDALRREQDERLAELGARVDSGLAELRESLQSWMHAREVRDRRDILAAGERDAVDSSARFVRESMAGARTFGTPAETLDHALSLAPRGGMALEFGVYSGATLARIAADRGGCAVYGFDSFEGLPEDWRAGFRAGTFAVDSVPEVEGAELVVGWFSDTLPGFLEAHPGPVDLLHLDADLYSSTATVLDLVGPRLHPGSVLVFDEYLNHPGWQDGEHRAWREHVATHDVEYVYEAFTHDHEQVVVVLTGAREVDAPTSRTPADEARPN
ncbi:class I SAM-dependent methyltransferase [Actinomycetospora endophytica]|uniref:Class I SAM-dependent methyltransferase n=1 Tax=Actinomycetospora endophytica TaxID=2291215 RepID=A0ABS8P4Y8_9PSEU|nr:class I SAM-dependent methyltransferase [Actinomycetospora endophytica]MCD2193323.1 class I SAM-dependent methyltransferase [Actinomycetospora endophytica]